MLIFLLNVPSRVPGYLFIVLYLHQPTVVNLTLEQRVSSIEKTNFEKSGSHWICKCECKIVRLMVFYVFVNIITKVDILQNSGIK